MLFARIRGPHCAWSAEMITKPVELVTKADIDSLIANEVREGRTLDYKETLPSGSEKDRKEFLRDVISFANAGGADLIFGVSERRDTDGKTTGIPDSAKGLAGINGDLEIRRLDDIVKNGVAPRITGIRIAVIEGFPDGPVLLLRVPRSWAAPHMLTLQTTSPFLMRRNASRTEMDVHEIRAAFLASNTVTEHIETFRAERMQSISSGTSRFKVPEGPYFAIHVFPFASADPLTQIDLPAAKKLTSELQPFGAGGWDYRFNFDGFISFAGAPKENEPAATYIQLFRSGVFEAVAPTYATPERKLLRVWGLEHTVVRAVEKFLTIQQRFGIEPPTIVLFTLVGVEGYRFELENPFLSDWGNRPIDRATLLLPDVLISELPADPVALLRPVFDALWQAAGFERCFHYDEKGEWTPMGTRR
jgi:hypothetical protein